ncbi:MAG: type pilus assembly protein PilV [Pseudomonadota bacterium]|jgi:type IV pilus assembly protein PilV
MLLNAAPQRGFSLVEVLVTIVVITVGLLGMFALQSRGSVIEMEAYQRAQAIALAQDMEARIRNNRARFDATFRTAYAQETAPAVWGSAGSVNCPAGVVGAVAEGCQWGELLLGKGETLGSGAALTEVGAMIGARGCVIASSAPTDGAVGEYFVVVVWQGLQPSVDPASGSPAATCASTVNYGSGLRRGVVTRVLVPKLEG